MKTGKLLGLLMLLTLMFNCSSVKVTDSWKDVKLSDIEGKKVMVLSKTDDNIVRERFEKDITENLKDNGVNAIESIKIFPYIDSKVELDKKEQEQWKKELLEQGIDVVLITTLKDVQEYTKTVTSGGSGYYINSYPTFYRRGYRGFYRYYNNVYINNEPLTSITSKGKKYIIETVIYDLTQLESEQLISVITTEIDNPETLGRTSVDFSKKLVKTLVK